MPFLVRDFRKLQVWHKARSLVREVYLVTEDYPQREGYGLTAQTRRCAISIPANLAEGCGRRGAREFARFVDIAIGSTFELESHLLLAHDLAFVESEAAKRALVSLDEVKRMLIGLANGLKRSMPSP
ncbi:MAG TPA: four helix bundle protein [Acidimicrobiia bacterium]|nr:four helix bundle protein [Acidimicrobiia bacterium]